MMEGWYAMNSTQYGMTNHFVINNGNSTLCRRAFPIKDSKKQVIAVKYDKDSNANCIMCERSFIKKYVEGKKRFTENEDVKLEKKIEDLNVFLTNKPEPFVINDEYHQIQTVCPTCGTDVCFYSKGESREHLCTVCNKMVEIPMGTVAS